MPRAGGFGTLIQLCVIWIEMVAETMGLFDLISDSVQKESKN